MTDTVAAGPRKGLNILSVASWLAQFVVFVMFSMAGVMKVSQPIEQLSAMMPWTGELPEWSVRAIGAIDLAGGIGILLPALLRIAPGLSVLAAAGCVALQACAIIFHLSRGEAAVVPFNVVLIALSAFVLWVRWVKAPIAPRG